MRTKPRGSMGKAVVAVVVAVVVMSATPARADEILQRDPETGSTTVLKAYKIVGEYAAEVRYRERKRGPIKTVPAWSVMDVRRRERPREEIRKLRDAMRWLDQGDAESAHAMLLRISGGGLRTDEKSGVTSYRSFRADDKSRTKRPTWWREYAHFFQAKALFVRGSRTGDRKLLQLALLALKDGPVPAAKKGTRSGGFLRRFDRGRSRFTAEALWMVGEIQRGLGRFAEAQAAFQILLDHAVGDHLGARWVLAARLGQAAVAREQGRSADAIGAARDAAALMKILLEKEARAWTAREIGVLHARARAEVAELLLAAAEANPSQPNRIALQRHVEADRPEAVLTQVAGLPAPQRSARLAGAYDSRSRVVVLGCLGWLALQKGELQQAQMAFREIAVRHFEDPDWHARALYHLAESLRAAARAKQGSNRVALLAEAHDAQQQLRRLYPNSPWARRG